MKHRFGLALLIFLGLLNAGCATTPTTKGIARAKAIEAAPSAVVTAAVPSTPTSDVIFVVADSIADPTRPAPPVIHTTPVQNSFTPTWLMNVQLPTTDSMGSPLTSLSGLTMYVVIGDNPLAGMGPVQIRATPGVWIVEKPLTLADAGRVKSYTVTGIQAGSRHTVYVTAKK